MLRLNAVRAVAALRAVFMVFATFCFEIVPFYIFVVVVLLLLLLLLLLFCCRCTLRRAAFVALRGRLALDELQDRLNTWNNPPVRHRHQDQPFRIHATQLLAAGDAAASAYRCSTCYRSAVTDGGSCTAAGPKTPGF